MALPLILGMAGANALLSANNAQQQKKQEQAGMMANAEAIRNSPWTGMNVSMQSPTAQSPLTAGLAGGLQGGLMGAQFGQHMKGVDMANAAEQVNAPSPGSGAAMGQSAWLDPQLQKQTLYSNYGSRMTT